MTPTNDTEPTTAHTPEPWTFNHTAIVQDSQGIILADCEMVAAPERDAPAPGQEVANARRICAAVNACKGISTEALERGILAELRHVLGELLASAADLDAAIDGATEEFDDERARLRATIHAAQAIQDGTELDLDQLLAGRGEIALGWSVEDVQQVRPDLSDEQAWQVLQRVERKHDATLGVTWDTLEWAAEDLFGAAPETASEEE
jgi:hypothetical protein